MEKIVGQIQGLYNALITGIADNKAVRTKLNAQASELNAEGQRLTAKAGNLDSREAKVSSIENILAINEENKTARSKLKADQNQLFIERKALEDYQAQYKKESLDAKQHLDSAISANKGKSEELDAGLKKLEEKKKTLREDVIKEIANNVKG